MNEKGMNMTMNMTFCPNKRKIPGNKDCPGIKYNNHKWICDDLKIIKFQLGQ